jgi:hypothetical protein
VPAGGAAKASESEQAEKGAKADTATPPTPPTPSDDKGATEGKPAPDAAKATAEPTQTITPEKSSAAKR